MKVSAYDGAQWRIERINRAIDIFCRISGITPEQLDRLVGEVIDDKGVLHVLWENDCYPPSLEQKWDFAKAWNLGGECHCDVEHSKKDLPL